MKIRGNTVGTNLRPEVMLTKATALTEEQKAKARENIGAASIDDISATDELVQAVIDALPVYDGSYSDVVEEYDGTVI